MVDDLEATDLGRELCLKAIPRAVFLCRVEGSIRTQGRVFPLDRHSFPISDDDERRWRRVGTATQSDGKGYQAQSNKFGHRFLEVFHAAAVYRTAPFAGPQPCVA